jgi:DNA-binding GntR family transcriptional regulator
MQMINRLQQETTREYVYRFLKINIMTLTLPPGSALSEKDIADLLKVSRTPVREAFIQLANEYLLDIIPQKGTYVSLIDLDNVEESKFLRETIERVVVELACTDFPKDKLLDLQHNLKLQEIYLQEKNYDKFYEADEFLHGTIFAGCKKIRTWEIIQQMLTHYNRVRHLTIAVGYDPQILLDQHKALVSAIETKDVELGRKTINLHLDKVKIDIKGLLRDYTYFFKNTNTTI